MITDIIQEELVALKERARELHFSDITPAKYEAQNRTQKESAS